jgi:uncharacterized protein YecE (DUF72 family)
MDSVRTTIRVGISGWRYKPWRGIFYPKGLRQKDELQYASRHVQVIEINGSFYSLQSPESYLQWKSETPEDFLFAVKGSRFITHMIKLKDPEQAMSNFLASGVLALEEKLGPILWQLSPNWHFHPERIESFLKALPTTGQEAAKLASGHDNRIKGNAWLQHKGVKTIRHAMEVRHPSFCSPEFIRLLRKYNVASVVSDSANRFPVVNDVTADFVYVRLHGHKELYSGGYPDPLLKEWARKLQAWSRGSQIPGISLVDPSHKLKKVRRDVFVFFDNDAKVDAPKDAARLISILNQNQDKPGRT